MTQEEKANNLLQKACEMCEGWSAEDGCEIQKSCPVHALYLMAKTEKIVYKQDVWSVPPPPRPEMI